MEMTPQTKHAIRVCTVDELPDGEAVRIPEEETGTGDAIAVFNDDGEFFALDDTCPHAGASLSDGWAEAGEVDCAMHGSQFCLRTGAVLTGPATRGVAAHGVEVREGEVWLLPHAAAGSRSPRGSRLRWLWSEPGWQG